MYDLMVKFAPSMLFEQFVLQYSFEHGELKVHKMAIIIKASDKINHYLNYIVHNSLTPSPEGLQKLLNSHSYFLFAKEETICVGCLAVVDIWSGKTYTGFNQEKEDLVTIIMANVIMHCKKLKYNQSDNFFSRFFRRLKDIEDSAED